MKETRGSITVFSLIALLLVTATLCCILEGVRYLELNRVAGLQTELAMEAVFADYETSLWKNYRILGALKESAQENMGKVANARVEEGQSKASNFLLLKPEALRLTGHQLITDENGKVFIKCVSTYMKDNVLYEVAKEIINQYESVRDLLEAGGVKMEYLDAALEEIEKIATGQEGKSVGTSGKNTILDKVKKWMTNAALALYIEDMDGVSKACLEAQNDIFARELDKGTKQMEDEITWLDRVLFQQYLLTYMSNYKSEKSGRALCYEIEYLLGEKASDTENLLAVCGKIVTIREAANLLYLTTDTQKMQQAQTLAVVLGGSTASVAAVETIRWGILAAWAFAESVLDVRALLAGKTIPFMKSDESWTLELENMETLGTEFQIAKESKPGLDYEGYIGILLLLESDENTAMRSLNVQEGTIRKARNQKEFQIDTLCIWAEGEVEYVYTPIFPFLEAINAQNRWEYKLCTRKEYGYY